jgi:hypothetical protein
VLITCNESRWSDDERGNKSPALILLRYLSRIFSIISEYIKNIPIERADFLSSKAKRKAKLMYISDCMKK